MPSCYNSAITAQFEYNADLRQVGIINPIRSLKYITNSKQQARNGFWKYRLKLRQELGWVGLGQGCG